MAEGSGKVRAPQMWTEDGNSPVTVSGAGSLDYNLAENYDLVKVLLHDIRGSGTADTDLQLTLNGDTGTNYTIFRAADSGKTTGNSHIDISKTIKPSNVSECAILLIAGRWTNTCVCAGFVGSEHPANVHVSGDNNAITSPLSSLSIVWGGGGTITGEMEVYGKDIG